MKQSAKRILVLAVGWGFILLGIAGLFLPVLQGILFLLIGLVILSTEYVWAHHLLRRVGERFPRLQGMMDSARQRADRWLGRTKEDRTKEDRAKAEGNTPGPDKT